MSKFRKPKFVTDQIYVTDIEYDKSKISKLFIEVENLNIYNLKKISLTDKIPLDVSIEDGSNLIHQVLKKPSNSQNQKINLIKFLVENNVNPDKTDQNNNTPLHLACENQEDLVIKYLLEIGCNPNFKNNFGMTPFHYYLGGIYKERILEKDFLSIIKVKDPLDLEQKELDLKLSDLINNDAELKLLENTFKEIINRQILDNIKVESKFDLLQVKGFLEKKVDAYTKNIFDFNDLDIHEKTINSLQTNHPTLSVLLNVNTNQILKNNIKEKINEIKNMIEETDINNINLNHIIEDNFETLSLNDDFIFNNAGSNFIHIYDNKYLFYTSIPANDYNLDVLFLNRIRYIKAINPNLKIDDTYIENQASKIKYLFEPILNQMFSIEEDDKAKLKNVLKLWLFILMDEGKSTDNLFEKYNNLKLTNQEVIIMDNLIDKYVDNNFKYEDRIKIFEKLVEQKNTRLFYNNLLFRDTLFVIKKIRTSEDLKYYLSVMSDINKIKPEYKGNINYRDFNDLSKKVQDILPSINLELLIINDNNLYKLHNFAYIFDLEILTTNNIEEPLDIDDVKNKIKMSLNSQLVNFNKLIDNFKNLFTENGIKKYGKIAPLYLTILTYFNHHFGRILQQNIRYIKLTNPRVINKIIENMNLINSYYYLYYYFNTEDKNLKIPKFYLYKIPKLEAKKDKLELTGNLIFDKNDENLISLDDFENKVTGDNGVESVIDKDQIKYINSLYNFADDSDIYSIYMSFDIIDDFYKKERTSSLPPSLMDNESLKLFMDIYFKTKMKNIKYEDIKILIKYKNTVPESEKEILDKNTIGLKLKERLINKINDIITQLIRQKMVNINEDILENTEVKSNYKINLNDISLKYKSMTNILPYYEYNLKPKIETNFLIYSDDYSSIQIEKSLLESIVNISGLKCLIENGASISQEDNYGKNPLENIIKNLNVDVYKEILELLKLNVDLNTLNNKKILDYLINSLKFEIDKYLDKDVLNSIIKFSLDQGNDIDIKVKNIAPQLDNKYYLLSYKIVNYLSNQMIGIMNILYNNDVDKLYEILDINKENLNKLGLNNISGFEDNDSLLLNNLIENLKKEGFKIKQEIKKLEDLGKDVTNLETKKQDITTIINKISKKIKSKSYKYELNKLDLDFIDKYGKIDNLVELEMFNNLLNLNSDSEISNDKLIILPRLLMKEKEYLDNLNVDNWKKYKILAKFYSKLEKECELYFIGNQFRIDNEMKEVVFKILLYLTKTVILSQIELLVKKILIEYFDNTYPSSAPNIARVEGILYNNTFTGDGSSNKEKLYNLAEKLILNSVYIFKNSDEKDNFMEKSIENILEDWLLEMIKSSLININENDEFISKLKIEINNFGFLKNIINNWLVVIENNLKFIINHSRLLKMLELTIVNI